MVHANSRLLTCLAIASVIFGIQSYFQDWTTLLVAVEVCIVVTIGGTLLIRGAKSIRFLVYPLSANLFIGVAFLSAIFYGRDSALFLIFSLGFFVAVVVMFVGVVFLHRPQD